MKKILFNGLGNRGWIGGIYYIKNIIFSCLQNKEITSKYELVLFIDEKHADIFEPFRGQITIRVFGKEGKLKLAWAQAKQVWFGGVKYCYALELNKTGKFFKNNRAGNQKNYAKAGEKRGGKIRAAPELYLYP